MIKYTLYEVGEYEADGVGMSPTHPGKSIA